MDNKVILIENWEKDKKDTTINIELMQKMDRYWIDIRFLLDKKDE